MRNESRRVWSLQVEEGGIVQEVLRKQAGFTKKEISRAKFLPDGIRKNGIRCRVTEKTLPGDIIEILLEAETQTSAHLTVNTEVLDILYEDQDLLAVNKPAGVVTATEDKKEKTVMDLITLQQKKDLFPVGRLDKDTEGLLLVTNDGELAHRLLSPKKHVDKCYFTRVTGQIHEEDIHRFKEGLDIGDEKKTLPADLEILSSGEISEAKVTICEGRYHQVKRMFEAIGCKVIYLKRLSMGSLTLDPALEKGAFRKLTEEEIAALLQPPRKEKE